LRKLIDNGVKRTTAAKNIRRRYEERFVKNSQEEKPLPGWKTLLNYYDAEQSEDMETGKR